MPLYEFECPDHGRFEVLLPRLPEEEWHECPEAKEILPGMWIGCIRRAPLVPSRVSMRPDTLWAGHYLENYGYVTSSSKVAQIRKEKHLVELGDRADREAIEKTAREGAKARDEKFTNDRRKLLEERLTGAGMVDSFGQLRPEATRKLSDEEILDPAGQERKKESITITGSNGTDD